MSTGPASRNDSLPRFGRGAALILFLLFLLLGVAFTAPLVRHLHDALPYAAVPAPGRELVEGAQGDYLQFYYYLWLVQDRLLAGASFLRDPYQFAVDGPRPNLPNIFLPAALLYVPLSALGHRSPTTPRPPVFPWPGSPPRSWPGATGRHGPAPFVAGVVFACAPYRVGALLGGHPAGLAYPLVPLVLWGVEGALVGSLGSGLVAGAALLGLAMMEPHFAYFAALGLPLYALARVGLPAWRRELLALGAGSWPLAIAVALAPAYGALGALAHQGWQAPLAVRLAVGAVIALCARDLASARRVAPRGRDRDGPADRRAAEPGRVPALAPLGARRDRTGDARRRRTRRAAAPPRGVAGARWRRGGRPGCP